MYLRFLELCLKIDELHPAKCLSSRFKEGKNKIKSFNWYWYVINGRKAIRGGIFHSIFRYAKGDNKCIKDYDENKESSYLQYWNVNNLCGWEMLQKLSVNNFEWIKDASQFNEDFIQN